MIKRVEVGKSYLDRSGQVRGPMRDGKAVYPGCPWSVFTDGEDYWVGLGIRMRMLDKSRRLQRNDPAELLREARSQG